MFLKVTALTLLIAAVVSAGAPEKDLAKHLIKTYQEVGIEGRPVQNVADALKVSVGFALVKILKADKTQLAAEGMLKLIWNDQFLKWDPAAFGGAQSIVLSPRHIWLPDISVWNDHHQSSSEQAKTMLETPVLINSDGTVYWIPKVTYKTTCATNNTEKPVAEKTEKVDKVAKQFDKTANKQAEKKAEKAVPESICSIVAGSWAHDIGKLDVQIDGGDIDVTEYSPNPHVELASHSATAIDKEYACCPGVKYRSVSFNLVIKKSTHCDAKHGACAADKIEI